MVSPHIKKTKGTHLSLCQQEAMPTLPVDVLEKGSEHHREVWSVAQGLQESGNIINVTPHCPLKAAHSEAEERVHALGFRLTDEPCWASQC